MDATVTADAAVLRPARAPAGRLPAQPGDRRQGRPNDDLHSWRGGFFAAVPEAAKATGVFLTRGGDPRVAQLATGEDAPDPLHAAHLRRCGYTLR